MQILWVLFYWLLTYGSIFNTKDEVLNFLNNKNVNFFDSFELIKFEEINGKVHLSLKKRRRAYKNL